LTQNVDEFTRTDRSWFSHLRPVVRGFEALGAPILKHSWSELIELLTPGEIIHNRCRELNMFPYRISHLRPLLPRVLKRLLELKKPSSKAAIRGFEAEDLTHWLLGSSNIHGQSCMR
jgi:hypothetical protein